MALSDTSPRARDVYRQQLAHMTPSQRVRIAAELWHAAHSLQRAVELRKNPDADEAEINFKISVSRFGIKLARAAYQRT